MPTFQAMSYKIDHLQVNFVPYFAWAAAEIAVALVCIGIPTLRPLYLKTRGINTIDSQARSNNNTNNAILPQFVMARKESYRNSDLSNDNQMQNNANYDSKIGTIPPRSSSMTASSTMTDPEKVYMPPWERKEMGYSYEIEGNYGNNGRGSSGSSRSRERPEWPLMSRI